MKKRYIFYYSLLFSVCFHTDRVLAQAGTSASATGHVVAEIVPAFTATETSQLNFGRFSPDRRAAK